MKPLLAATIEDTTTLQWPLLVSAKLDGIRALVIDGVVMSRSLKPIRNKFVQSRFGKPQYDGFDGELIVGPPNAEDVYRTTNSGVMSEEGEPDVKFYVFDRFDMPEVPYKGRLDSLGITDDDEVKRGLVKLEQWTVTSEEELLGIESAILNAGYEGLMLRKADAPYKFGRSTLKEMTLGKLKRFSDAEYRIVGFVERFHNSNAATRNELGYIERSSHKENLIGRGDLGALILETDDGQRFNCGTGFTDALRAEIWAQRDAYLGKFAKVKSFMVGVKDLPRFPVWVCLRDPLDL
jgi:DNA ligase 1